MFELFLTKIRTLNFEKLLDRLSASALDAAEFRANFVGAPPILLY
jgi:hypothetical protein